MSTMFSFRHNRTSARLVVYPYCLTARDRLRDLDLIFIALNTPGKREVQLKQSLKKPLMMGGQRLDQRKIKLHIGKVVRVNIGDLSGVS